MAENSLLTEFDLPDAGLLHHGLLSPKLRTIFKIVFGDKRPGMVGSMPRFFFDLDDGDRLFRDGKGCDLHDLCVAREEAIAVLPDIVRAMVTGGDRKTLTSSIRDDAGKIVFGVKISVVGD